MDDIDQRIAECFRRLRELAADVETVTATLHDLQLEVRLDTTHLAHLLTHRGDRRDIDDCFHRLYRLSAATEAASHDIDDAQRHIHLELALIDTFHHRRSTPALSRQFRGHGSPSPQTQAPDGQTHTYVNQTESGRDLYPVLLSLMDSAPR